MFFGDGRGILFLFMLVFQMESCSRYKKIIEEFESEELDCTVMHLLYLVVFFVR